MDAEPFDPSDFPKEAFDPETFDPEEHRSPAVPFNLDDWEKRQNQALHKYLYPEDESEEDWEARTDILVYADRVAPEEWLEEHPGDVAPEDAPETMREAPFLHRWRMRRPVKQMKVSTNPDAPDEEWHTLIDNTGEQKTGEVYGPTFHTRPGGPTYTWLIWAAMFVERIQCGRFKRHDSVRSELVRLLRGAAICGPDFQATLEDGTKRDATEPIWRQLLRSAEEIEDGANTAKLYPDFDPESLPIYGEDDAPVPRPENTAASSAEWNGFFPFASGAPSSVGAKAIRQGKHGWPETDSADRPKYPFTQKRPHHVEGQFTIIVPDSNQAGAAVEAEVAQRVLNEFDRHTTRLHLACAAYSMKGDPGNYTPIPRQYVYDMLGVKWDQRSDLKRNEKDRKVERAVRNLRKLGVQINVLDGPDGAPERLGLESVWNLNWHKWGQKRISDPDRIFDTEHWRLLVRPNAWHQLYLSEESGVRQFGYFSRKLLENIDWHNNPAAGDLAIELLKYVRFQDGGAPRDVTVKKMLEICGLGRAQKSYEQTRNRGKLERAILEQERWGWNVEWTRWPDAYRPDKENRPDFPRKWWQGAERDDWECSFHDWKVTFYPPEDLAEMNSRAKEIDSSNPHELEPKGWPERIKAILNETEYIQADLARILEVSSAAVTQWKKGNRTPEGPHRAKLKDIERRNELRND